MSVEFRVDGVAVSVPESPRSLLEVLRDELGVRSVKDGCSPQGQCGCCTVLVDGSPRVACVTPVARVSGREVTTVDGLADGAAWAEAFAGTGASQCGFCTPGIIVRLSALSTTERRERRAVDSALLAHLCRCTGWQTIREAAAGLGGAAPPRDVDAARRRAEIEGGVAQDVGPEVALGRGGFADDTSPPDALVAIRSPDGAWVVGDSVSAARQAAGTVQGRRTTAPASWPIDPPVGSWERTLSTTWVEPAYLEPDASWCVPGGVPADPLGNGGAFGGKASSEVAAVARRLADEHGRPVRVLWSREDVVRRGPKRPPVAIGIDRHGAGVIRLARPAEDGHADRLIATIGAVAPGLVVDVVDVAGPPVSAALRGSGWAEAAAVVAAHTAAPDAPVHVVGPEGGEAWVAIDEDGTVGVRVRCGAPLDEIVLRSYCIGAVHMALGMVRGEAIAVDEAGNPLDLTIRSFGVLRARDTPDVRVEVVAAGAADRPVNGGDAVFAATLGAAWRAAGFPPRLPA